LQQYSKFCLILHRTTSLLSSRGTNFFDLKSKTIFAVTKYLPSKYLIHSHYLINLQTHKQVSKFAAIKSKIIQMMKYLQKPEVQKTACYTT